MAPTKKRIFALLALIFLVIAVVALTYTWLPSEILRDVIPITPTYFQPPAGIP